MFHSRAPRFAVVFAVLCLSLAFVPACFAVRIVPQLPHNLDYFNTTGPSGFVNPEVLVGFNPQPDPPGDDAQPDLSDPFAPFFSQPGTGQFTILFGLKDAAGESVSFNLPGVDPTVNSDGHALYDFTALLGNHSYQVGLDIGGYTGSWSGFNPQPDPPGFGPTEFVGFSFFGDPTLTVHLNALDANGAPAGAYSFSPVASPEPMSLLLVASGLAGVIIRRRK